MLLPRIIRLTFEVKYAIIYTPIIGSPTLWEIRLYTVSVDDDLQNLQNALNHQQSLEASTEGQRTCTT